MNGNCHFVFGTALGTAVAININAITNALPNLSASPETTTLFIIGGLVGGILPDIDNPTSYIGKLSVPVSTMIGSVGKLTGKTGSNHRGILHDATFYLIGLIISYLYFPPILGVLIGCLSHLFLDAFNPSGIPFLFGTKRIHLGKIPSGGKGSILFTWFNVSIVLIAGILVKMFYIF